MTRILVVEDEPGIALGLEDDLKMEGYEVEVACDGITAARRAREGGFDLILLDVMLPGKDGFEVCRELRRAGLRTPILMLTAKAHEAEKVMGLELGADDYVTKPFGTRELRARIKALLRRAAGESEPECCRFGDVEVDFARGELRLAGQPVELTPIEFKLLDVFVRARGRVLSRDQLIAGAWGRGHVCLGAHRGQPHRQPAAQDRSRPGGTALSAQCARAGLPFRWLKCYAILTLPGRCCDSAPLRCWLGLAALAGGSKTDAERQLEAAVHREMVDGRYRGGDRDVPGDPGAGRDAAPGGGARSALPGAVPGEARTAARGARHLRARGSRFRHGKRDRGRSAGETLGLERRPSGSAQSAFRAGQGGRRSAGLVRARRWRRPRAASPSCAARAAAATADAPW